MYVYIFTGTVNDRVRLDVSFVCQHRTKSFHSVVIGVRLYASH